MADVVDELQIEINAKATKANDAIDRLVGKLDRLTTSLGRVSGTNLNGLANGVQRLGNAMQVMNTIKTADFTRLATNLTKLGAVNVSALNSAASSMSHLTRAFNSLGTVSANAQAVGEMAKNIAKLGNKSVQTAITNIPQLATAMNNLMATLSRSPQVSQNVIQMTNALANLASQGSKVGSTSNSIVRGLNKVSASANTAKKSFGGLASVIGKFYAKYFLAIRGLKGLRSSIESTADYIEAFNYYTVSFGKIASKWDSEWENYADEDARNYANSFVTTMNETFKKISGVSFDPQKGLISESGLKNLGLNIQEVTQYAAQLASMMDAVGQSGETTLATTNAFVKLAGDISSLYNIDYSEAANKIRSVLQGQSRAGYGFGWDTTMASLQATADKLNLSKAVNEMSQMEKQQLRILTILQQSRVAWGDQSNTINTLANQIRIFKNNIKEAAMTLGQLFVPILAKIMPIINGITIAIKNLMTSIAGMLGIEIKDIGQGFSDIGDEADVLSDALDDVNDSAKKATGSLSKLDELNVINTPESSKSASGVGGGGIDLTQQILDATAEYEKVWQEAYDQMENRAQIFADKVGKIFEPVKKIFQDFAFGDFFQAGKDVSSLVVSITDFFAKAIDTVDWYGIGRKIGEFISGIDWTEVLKSVGKLIWEAVSASIELWEGMFNAAPIETTIITAIGLLKFTGLGNILATKITSGITAAWVSLGGLGGILTADLATVMAAGTAAEIGLTIGTGIIGGISAAFVGFSIGQLLYEETSGEEIDMSFKEQFNYLKGAFETGELSEAIKQWWNDDVVSFYEEKIQSIGDKVGEKFESISKEFDFSTFFLEWQENWELMGSYISDWWVNSVEPWFTKEKWSEVLSDVKASFEAKWDEIDQWWQNTALAKWWDEHVAPWFSKKKWTDMLDSIPQAFKDKFKEAANNATDMLNNIIGGLEKMINGALQGVKKLAETANKIPGINIDVNALQVRLPRIQRYETGGYPQKASLFWAGENGIPELAGTIGGKTAVASGAEITGIRDEIRNTSSQEIGLLKQQNSLLQAILNKQFGITTNDIGQAAREFARDYSVRNGRPAYDF